MSGPGAADLTVSEDGNVRVDDKGLWNTPQRVSSIISLFGGSVNRRPPPPRVLDGKAGAGGKVQMSPAASADVDLPALRYNNLAVPCLL